MTSALKPPLLYPDWRRHVPEAAGTFLYPAFSHLHRQRKCFPYGECPVADRPLSASYGYLRLLLKCRERAYDSIVQILGRKASRGV